MHFSVTRKHAGSVERRSVGVTEKIVVQFLQKLIGSLNFESREQLNEKKKFETNNWHKNIYIHIALQTEGFTSFKISPTD